MNLSRLGAIAALVSLPWWVLPLSANAQPATRIQFARGSYCGSYSGDFSGGRRFVLNLGGGQTFTTRNIGGGNQYNISVYGPNGRVPGEQMSESQLEFFVPRSGDYYVNVASQTEFNAIEFCAY